MSEPFTMPIQNRKGPDLDGPFVWVPTKADKDQAYRNHGQTLGRLAERGGMAWCEMAYILLNQRFGRGTRISQDPAYAKAACHDVLIARAKAAAETEWGRIPPAHRFGRFLTEDAVPLIAPGSLLRFYSADPWFDPGPKMPRNGQIVVFTGNVNNDFPKVGPHLEVATLDGKVWPGGGWVFRLFQFVSDPVDRAPA